jgi:hypothetical protein
MVPHWIATCPCGWVASAETYAHMLALASQHETERSGQTGAEHPTTIALNPRRQAAMK